MGEPVSTFDRTPEDYAQMVTELIEDGVPILGINFQGYEVTLPRSWPYVEAVFAVAKRHAIRRTFITNGMLLAKHIESLVELDPHRVAISLDGADAEANDRLRGVAGAFRATVNNVERFAAKVPQLVDRLSIVSTLYDEANFRSLLNMPSLIQRLGLSRWALTMESQVVEGRQVPVRRPDTVSRWLGELEAAANARGLRFYFADEFGVLKASESDTSPLSRSKGLFYPDFIVRVEPTGHLRVGRELLMEWRPDEARLWRPGRRRVAEVIGYWDAVDNASVGRAPSRAPS